MTSLIPIVYLMLKLQPDLSGNPFLRVLHFNLMEIVCKKDWERKAEIAAIKIISNYILISKFMLWEVLLGATLQRHVKFLAKPRVLSVNSTRGIEQLYVWFFSKARLLHILYLFRNVVKRRVAIHFVFRGFVKCFGIVGICGVNMLGFYNPNADALHPSGVNIACVLDCHLSICRVETADVLMVEALSASDENLPKWPFCILHNISD